MKILYELIGIIIFIALVITSQWMVGRVGAYYQRHDTLEEQRAREYLSVISVPTIENCARWELQDFHVFGPDSLFYHMGTFTMNTMPARTFYASVTVWCEGKDASGRVVRQQKLLNLEIDKISGRGVNYKVISSEPLGLGRQFLTWLGISVFLPLVCILIMLLICGMIPALFVYLISKPRLIGLFHLLFTVFVVGYTASVCFGSTLAIVVCEVGFLPVLIAGVLLLLGRTDLLSQASVNIGLFLAWTIALFGVGFMLWKVVPYIATGTWDWFRWLGGISNDVTLLSCLQIWFFIKLRIAERAASIGSLVPVSSSGDITPHDDNCGGNISSRGYCNVESGIVSV